MVCRRERGKRRIKNGIVICMKILNASLFLYYLFPIATNGKKPPIFGYLDTLKLLVNKYLNVGFIQGLLKLG